MIVFHIFHVASIVGVITRGEWKWVPAPPSGYSLVYDHLKNRTDNDDQTYCYSYTLRVNGSRGLVAQERGRSEG